jgi:CRP-like cAMP-binding protein
MGTLDLLAQSPLFAGLPDEERAAVARQLVQRRYEKDEYLFFEGDAAEVLAFVAEGRVKMIKHSESGRETILATFGPGQIVGEVAALSGEDYPATAQALEPTTTLSLQRAVYVALVQAHPELAWALIEELGRRLQGAHETIRSLAVEKVERRVARVLLRMANTTGERLEEAGTPPGATSARATGARADTAAVRITISLSRQDIADMAGTVLETAIRAMSKFQREGLVETREGHIVLLQPHRLVAIAEEL